jgi:hypothetical protein
LAEYIVYDKRTPRRVGLVDEEGTPRKVGLVGEGDDEEGSPHLMMVPALMLGLEG